MKTQEVDASKPRKHEIHCIVLAFQHQEVDIKLKCYNGPKRLERCEHCLMLLCIKLGEFVTTNNTSLEFVAQLF